MSLAQPAPMEPIADGEPEEAQKQNNSALHFERN